MKVGAGKLGFYHPDWVVVQKAGAAEANWIIETKGRVWEGTANKDAAIEDWCNRITDYTGELWKFKRIDQVVFNRERSAPSLAELVDAGNRLV